LKLREIQGTKLRSVCDFRGSAADDDDDGEKYYFEGEDTATQLV